MRRLSDLVCVYRLFFMQCADDRQRYEDATGLLIDPAAVLVVIERGESTHDWLADHIQQMLLTDLASTDDQYFLRR